MISGALFNIWMIVFLSSLALTFVYLARKILKLICDRHGKRAMEILMSKKTEMPDLTGIPKLVEATAPICPNCGYEMSVSEHRGKLPPKCLCGACGKKADDAYVKFGYYAPDIDEVIEEIEAITNLGEKAGIYPTRVKMVGWITKLRGEK